MNTKTAIKILGINEDASFDEIRRQYRKLMIMTHPDMMTENDYPYDAGDINAAYEYLNNNFKKIVCKENSEVFKVSLWNAPLNENAYEEREILEYAEDSYGEIHGTISIARGKYNWTEDEDFSLFLLSIYNCCKEIIERSEIKKGKIYIDEKKEILLKEIAYLLAGQYVNPYIMTEKYKKGDVYIIPSMLEYTGTKYAKMDEAIYPKGIKNHRLYLQNSNNEELGYLSFKDDRLYYCLIPSFESRRVVVKLRVSTDRVKKTGMRFYSDVELKMMFKDEEPGTIIDSINIRIDNLLENGF